MSFQSNVEGEPYTLIPVNMTFIDVGLKLVNESKTNVLVSMLSNSKDGIEVGTIGPQDKIKM